MSDSLKSAYYGYLDRSAEEKAKRKSGHLIAIGGLSGTGKSTVARALAETPGILGGHPVILDSDVVRKEMYGTETTAKLPPAAYSKDASRALYNELMSRATENLDEGRTVIIAATFSTFPDLPREIETTAKEAGARFTGVWLEADADTLVGRVNQRVGDASDADGGIVRQQLDSFDPAGIPWPRVDAGGGVPHTMQQVTALLHRDERRKAPKKTLKPA